MKAPQVTVRAEADGVCVVCSSEFDLDATALLVDACNTGPTPDSPLVMDVRQVTFGDSSFLNVLIRLRTAHPLVLQPPLPNQLQCWS
ncbi:hypothetical protein [Streptomyces sp. NRRL F-2664]|uniref:hypothetical protein n=1 Tax=Streptomyces sp. NRRL F-2664 TaxID=1463842 RepID=UPI0004C5B5F3|nr:hypothetical protein [Streptomyces sp. NRRL F-2664]